MGRTLPSVSVSPTVGIALAAVRLLNPFANVRLVGFPCNALVFTMARWSHQSPDELIQTQLKQLVPHTHPTFVLDRRERILDH